MLLICLAWAQTPKTYTASEIFQQVKKLNVLGSVLYIAAHPDDENTRLIAYLANDKLYRAGYLSITRGDGGQNLVGNEQGIELGLMRTQELLAARRIDGGEQFFTRGYDFGFSKSTSEALKTWGHDKVLADVVWVIRKFQPDVIITRFPPDSRAGHGHHSASAVLAAEAFDAAADPNRFPEQFDFGVKPWQAKRLLWNTFNFGDANTIDSTQFALDAGGFNPLLGKSYGELAGESRSQHKSQGFGVPRSRGSQVEFFNVVKGDKPAQDLTGGVDVSWKRVDGSGNIGKQVNKIIASFSVEHPEASVPALVAVLNQIKALPDGHWKTIKQQETEQLIARCAGIYAEATTSAPVVYQDDSLKLNISILNRSSTPVTLSGYSIISNDYNAKTIWVNAIKKDTLLAENKLLNFSLSQFVGRNITISQPYWLVNEKSFGSYDVEDQSVIGRPDPVPPFTLQLTLNYAGNAFTLQQPLQYKSNDPVKGEVYQPVVVAPQLEAQFAQDNYVSVNEKQITVVAGIKSNAGDTASYGLVKKIPDNWAASNGNVVFKPSVKNTLTDSSKLVPTPNSLNTSATLSLINLNGFAGYKRVINYDYIPAITYFSPAKTHLINLDIKTAGSNIGYIEGAGDKVAQDLQLLGYKVTILKQDNITPEYLAQFDAIVTGVRAYNIHQWLSDKYDVLMAYVQQGGNLIVQYNTSGNVGTQKAKISPYPLNIGRSRITDETAAVNFLLPQHPVLHFPNKITAKDFDGWIQERSIYHADQLDAHFATPIAMADPGEAASNGALVIAPYGKGNFVYTGLVFFRELPAGVAGAYRLIANLIALPKN
jgi:LmbE family N-acetylglucosaminyl deacetylase